MQVKRGRPSFKDQIVYGSDTKLIEYLYQCLVASIEQINRDVFNNASISYCYRILKKLERLGYIEKKYVKLENKRPKTIFSITLTAFKEVISRNGILDIRKGFKSHDACHDLALTDIRYHFKKCKAVKNYYTENYLQSGLFSNQEDQITSITKLNPDALVELRAKARSYYYTLEYELTRKHIERIKNKFRQFYINENLTGTIYICKNENLRKYLAKIDELHFDKYPPKIFFALFEDLQNPQSQLTFLNRNKVKLTIK